MGSGHRCAACKMSSQFKGGHAMQKTSFLLILGASLSVLVCAQPARAASLMGTLAAPQRAGAAEPAEGSSAEAEPMSKESEELCAAAASGRTEDAKRLLENGAA